MQNSTQRETHQSEEQTKPYCVIAVLSITSSPFQADRKIHNFIISISEMERNPN